MTIALGVLTTSNVVIAADTLESRSAGYPKTNTPKIMNGIAPGFGSVSVTGAGDSGYLDAIRQEIVAAFLDHSQANQELAYFEKVLAKIIKKFHVQHIIPFAKYPSDERPFIELVVGAAQGSARGLWVTDRSTIRHAIRTATVGVGSGHANAILARVIPDWVSGGVAALIAAYVVQSCKRSVEGCGGDTNIVVLEGDVPKQVPGELVEELDALFYQYQNVESKTLLFAMGHPGIDLSEVSLWLGKLKTTIAEIERRI